MSIFHSKRFQGENETYGSFGYIVFNVGGKEEFAVKLRRILKYQFEQPRFIFT